MPLKNSITKRDLWRYVNLKLNRSIHRYHVFAVINILFEEMAKDLASSKPIKIGNLGTIRLEQTKPRYFYHAKLRQLSRSSGRKLMKFVLSKKMHDKLINYWDLDKYLSGN